jgi:multidrug transporter EmrE-like cation transporter
MGWIYLMLAAAFEVGFTTALRYTDHFRNVPAVIVFLVCTALSLVFLELANRSIPLGTAYAVWTGLGAAGTVVVGMAWFGEPATVVRGLLIVGIVACAAGLKATSGH